MHALDTWRLGLHAGQNGFDVGVRPRHNEMVRKYYGPELYGTAFWIDTLPLVHFTMDEELGIPFLSGKCTFSTSNIIRVHRLHEHLRDRDYIKDYRPAGQARKREPDFRIQSRERRQNFRISKLKICVCFFIIAVFAHFRYFRHSGGAGQGRCCSRGEGSGAKSGAGTGQRQSARIARRALQAS